MRRLVLPAWTCGLLLTVDWLRHLRTGDDPGFAAARGFALALAAYLAVATVVTVVLALCRVRVRLPLVPLLVVASLSTPIAAPAAFAAPTPTTTTTSVPAPPVMHRLSPPTQSAPAPSPAPPAPTPPAAAPAPAPTPARAATWRVRHGDCFWSISRRVVAARLGRAPTNAEIVSYWRPLIEANRSRLVRPDNPGLLFAGQELVLP